jgi:hypothetical protein
MNPERSVDTLSGLAPLLRVRPELQQLCRFGAQWASDHAVELDCWAPFHFVTKGACVIELSGLGALDPAFGRRYRRAAAWDRPRCAGTDNAGWRARIIRHPFAPRRPDRTQDQHR